MTSLWLVRASQYMSHLAPSTRWCRVSSATCSSWSIASQHTPLTWWIQVTHGRPLMPHACRVATPLHKPTNQPSTLWQTHGSDPRIRGATGLFWHQGAGAFMWTDSTAEALLACNHRTGKMLAYPLPGPAVSAIPNSDNTLLLGSAYGMVGAPPSHCSRPLTLHGTNNNDPPFIFGVNLTQACTCLSVVLILGLPLQRQASKHLVMAASRRSVVGPRAACLPLPPAWTRQEPKESFSWAPTRTVAHAPLQS